MNKKYVVRLTAEEREQLQRLVQVGKVAGCKIRHANMLFMLLMLDVDGPALLDEQVCVAPGVSLGQCEHLRKRLVVVEGLPARSARSRSG